MSEQNSLDAYKGKGNLLMPTTSITQVSPWHQMAVTEVKISADPADGEVFKQAAKASREKIKGEWQTIFVEQFSLGKVALMKIAQAAGITWDYNQCGPVNVSRDYVLYKAVGMLRLPAGNWQVIPATKEIDISVIEDELMEQNLKKAAELANSGNQKDKAKLQDMTEKEWAERQTKSALIQWRKHKLARAETGAMERVIRAALSMKQTYTAIELAKPFVVPRIDFSPDYTDPNVQRLTMENGVRAMNALFGNSMSIPSFAPNNIVAVVPEDDYTVDDVEIIPDVEEEIPVLDKEAPVEEPKSSLEVEPNECEECGSKGLSEKVIDYSIKRYNKRLCMACQKKQ